MLQHRRSAAVTSIIAETPRSENDELAALDFAGERRTRRRRRRTRWGCRRTSQKYRVCVLASDNIPMIRLFAGFNRGDWIMKRHNFLVVVCLASLVFAAGCSASPEDDESALGSALTRPSRPIPSRPIPSHPTPSHLTPSLRACWAAPRWRWAPSTPP